eukprot:627828-Pelagomonas_calceolata.AAC.1
MEGSRTPVWALLILLPATLFSTKHAIKQFDGFQLYTHFSSQTLALNILAPRRMSSTRGECALAPSVQPQM